MLDTRTIFFDNLDKHMEREPNAILLTGDLGFNFIEGVMKKYPDRVINAGIAEQNMVGMAAGLARAGKRPLVYSGAKFLLTRALEFVRDDIAFPNLDVKLVGTGAAGFLGHTHNYVQGENPRQLVTGMPHINYMEPRSDLEMLNAIRYEGPLFIRL